VPEDAVGLVVFSDSENTISAIDAVGKRIFRAAFGLAEQSSDRKRVSFTSGAERSSRNGLESSKTMSMSEGSLPGIDFTGAYAAPGYGPGFTLCNTSRTSHHCLQTLKTLRASLGPDFIRSADLFAARPRLWCSHILLQHLNGTLFSLSTLNPFPEGHGRDDTPFELGMGVLEELQWVECVVEGGEVVGCGLFGTVLGSQRTIRERKGGNIEQKAEACFAYDIYLLYTVTSGVPTPDQRVFVEQVSTA